MFTGIIETIGVVKKINSENSNIHFTIASNMVHELKIDQSIAHNGVCLTIVEINENNYTVTAIDETIRKTNLGSWQIGDKINLERCMPANGRFDGHVVQGHVDTTAVCTLINDFKGSWEYTFELPLNSNINLMVDKGSICINGISLTIVSAVSNTFRVAIIPYTYEFTNMHQLKEGSIVNIEFDILGKYIAKILQNRNEGT